MSSPDRPSRTGLWLALVLVVSFGAYAPALLNGFTFDDAVYVKAQTQAGVPNPMVAELRPLPEYFERPMNVGVSYTRGYRPVTVYSYALVHHLFRTKLCFLSTSAIATLLDAVYLTEPWDHSTVGLGFPCTSEVNLASSPFLICRSSGLVAVGEISNSV